MRRPYAARAAREITENPQSLRRYPAVGKAPASCPRERTPSFA